MRKDSERVSCYIFLMTSAQAPSYGQLLKRIRLTKRDAEGRPQPWTQYELHRLSGVAESEICAIEKGRRSPQDGTRVKLATALEAPELLPADL
jgi:transcriptional regulator with XRE-family HTH domain